MDNLLIGAISGNYNVSDISKWVETSNTISAKRILLLYNNNPHSELVPYLTKNGVEVILPEHNMYGEFTIQFPTNTGTMDINSSYDLVHNLRFFHIWQILNESEFDKVLITDVRDVYFNRDPFADIPAPLVI